MPLVTHNTLAFNLILVGTGGLIVAAYMLYGYVLGQSNPEDKRKIDRGFAIPMGLIGILGLIGAYQLFFTEWMSFPVGHYTGHLARRCHSRETWDQASELYGTTLAIFSGLMVIGSFTLYTGSDLRPVSYLAAIGGIVMFQAGRAVLAFELSRYPNVTATLYALAGVAGLAFIPATHIPDKKRLFTVARVVAAAIVVLMSILALYQGTEAMYGHIASAVAG